MAAPLAEAPAIAWVDWSPEVFARARAEQRLVLLDLGAVWCHWCHVMEATTYTDPAVRALLAEGYVAVQVDQDQRPDLATRYQDYGWPATILFDADGRELAKLRGYLPPARMASLLRAHLADPSPGPSVRRSRNDAPAAKPPAGSLAAAAHAELRARLERSYDREHGGFGFVHKYLDADAVEHLLAAAARGDREAEAMARGTLAAELALVDPAFGGVYQYSHGGTWENPHFEKIMTRQAGDLRCYALATALWHEPEHAGAARSIVRFLRETLTSPAGAFWSSQDADLVRGEHAADYFALPAEERRRRGLPRIDQNLYARENGLAIEALCAFHAASGDREALAMARAAAAWVLVHRRLPGGGFTHGERDRGGPFLSDQLAMGQACLRLHEVTAEPSWLTVARETAAFVQQRFASGAEGGGLISAPSERPDATLLRDVDENVLAARFFGALFHYTGDESLRRTARRAFGFAAAALLAGDSARTAGLLQADAELASEPLHVTVVGERGDARAAALFAAALALPVVHRRIEWQDPAGPPLPRADVQYPALETPAAFRCTEGACSAPIVEAAELRAAVERAMR